ncbi:MAG: archaeal heat shock protein Hsp20 [Candidatus Marsarchaeota archaeon]|jgi:HSP20 family protein
MSERRRDRERDWFDELMDEFERISEEADAMIDSIFDEAKGRIRREDFSFGPYIYGFSVSVGPDGKPVFKQFGNVKPSRRGLLETKAIEPYYDVMEDKKNNQIKVYIEMPGVSKEQIHLTADENELHVEAKGEHKEYEADIPLDVPVDVSSASATYNNGVLEVTLKPKEPLQKPGNEIKIQ